MKSKWILVLCVSLFVCQSVFAEPTQKTSYEWASNRAFEATILAGAAVLTAGISAIYWDSIVLAIKLGIPVLTSCLNLENVIKLKEFLVAFYNDPNFAKIINEKSLEKASWFVGEVIALYFAAKSAGEMGEPDIKNLFAKVEITDPV